MLLQTLARRLRHIYRHWTQTLEIPASVVFATSGIWSTPLRLCPHHEMSGTIASLKDEHIVMDRRLNEQPSVVFGGSWYDNRFVAKMGSQQSPQTLLNEFLIYTVLQGLQGKGIPTCYGIFTVGNSPLLLLEDCGSSVESLDRLSMAQRFVFEQPCCASLD